MIEALEHGVEVVWLLFPRERRVVWITAEQERTLGVDDRIPEHPALPGLRPPVARLFEQVAERLSRATAVSAARDRSGRPSSPRGGPAR